LAYIEVYLIVSGDLASPRISGKEQCAIVMPNSRNPHQLALTLPHHDNFAREDFLPGPSNAVALTLIAAWPDWPARIVALVGPAGAGKSHLAEIWAAESGARCVSGRDLGGLELPTALVTGALVVDDLVEGNVDERALFHLLNLAREEGAYMLLTMRVAPSRWDVSLRDLASRLRALPVVNLATPDEALLRAILVKLFADRQIAVEESLITYLITRIERSCAAAREAVIELDREALRQKRAITRALAADLYRDRP
jgi:chromosomal replication initiation ATPase DnaA